MAKGTAAEILYKGSDARLKAIRNNLVRNLQENLDNIRKLTKEEVMELVRFLDPASYGDAGKALSDAIAARIKEHGIVVSEVTTTKK